MATRRAFAGYLAAAWLFAPLSALAQGSFAVRASGEIPGFRIEDCPPWLAAQMDKAGGAWRFVPGATDAAAPDRVEWNFTPLPYAGGQVRQFFPIAQQMLGRRRLISAQAKLFIRDEYQTAILGQDVVTGGAEDTVLAAFITRATRNLLNGYAAIDMTQATRRAP